MPHLYAGSRGEGRGTLRGGVRVCIRSATVKTAQALEDWWKKSPSNLEVLKEFSHVRLRGIHGYGCFSLVSLDASLLLARAVKF